MMVFGVTPLALCGSAQVLMVLTSRRRAATSFQFGSRASMEKDSFKSTKLRMV
jgi:hypothetical protein